MISYIANIVSYFTLISGRQRKWGFTKFMLVAGFLFSGVLSNIFGQSNYYSKSAGNLEVLATWGQNIDGTGAAPIDFSSANQVFNVRNNAAPSIGGNWTVSGAGSRVIIGDATSPCILTIPGVLVFTAPCEISNLGTLKVSGTAVTPYSGTLTVLNGGTYEHARNGGAIPAATWNLSSNCNVTGVTNTIPTTTSFNQTFGNLTWNCIGQSGQLYLESNINIAGNFVVTETGIPFNPTVQSLRISNSVNGYTINVGGNVVIDNNGAFKMNNSSGSCILNIGGNLSVNNGNFTICTGTVNSTVNVNGSVSVSGGTLCLKEDNTAFSGILNVKGNFTHSNGTITHLDGGSGPGVINFTGNSVQTFSRTGGTFLNLINFTVNTGSILDVGTSTINGSTGTFTLNSGAGIITAHSQGLSSSGGTGSIQVSGSRTYNSGADYTYNGSVAQITGNAISGVHNLTINNPAGTTLTDGISVSGFLSLTQGTLITGSNVLYLTNNASASLSYSASGYINGNFERNINTTSSDYYFPVGVSRQQIAKFNFSDLTNGSLRVSFLETDPAGSGLPLYDTDGQPIQNEFNDGYWSVLAQSGLSSTDYSLTLDATGFSDPDIIRSSSRIINRTGTGDWTIDGTPGLVTGTIVGRLGCSSIDNISGTQFGIGTGNCFSFTTQPSSLTRCSGGNASFSVSVSGGLGLVSYQWYKDGGQLSNGGNVTGATTNTLVLSNITSIDEASYYCLVTDNCSSQSSQTVLLTIPRPAAALGYRFQKSITTDHTRVDGGSDLYNFPMLINISSDPDLRDSIPHGGHVQSSNGYDIIFTDGNYNKLDHQIETYDPATGRLVVWVRLPVLSASVNTTVLMLYDNPQISVDPSVKTVWKYSYQGVWHMGDNPGMAAPQLRDAARSNNGTSQGGMALGNLVPGNSGYAIRFDGANDYFDVGNGISPSRKFTEEFWVKTGPQFDNGYHGILGLHPAGGDIERSPSVWVYENDRVHAGFGDGTGWQAWETPGGVLTINDITWNHVVTTFNGTDYKLYVNGSEVYSTPDYAGLYPFNTPISNIGKVDNYFRGSLDEVRVLSEALTAGWIVTEFNNQGSPLSFYTIGGQSPCSAYSFTNVCSGSPVTYSVPSASGHTYSWSFTGGTPSSPNGNSITMTWNASGPYLIQLTESDGTCSLSSIAYSVVVTAPPVSHNIIKLPDLPDVCVTGAVSATFSGGSGGINPLDVYESSIDGGASWQPYTPASNISSAVAGSNRLQIRSSRTSAGTGCSTSAYNIVTWNTVAQPVSQTITKSPDVTDVCVTGTVSATFSSGSGGINPIDVYESSVDGGATWLTYTPGSSLSSAVPGLNRIQIRTNRTSTGTGCIASAYNLVTWNTVSQPIAQTITPSPVGTDVCVTGNVSATFSGGSGGVNSTDEYESSVDGGSTWLVYTPGSPISSATAGANRLQIRTRRISAGTGCTNSAYNSVIWNVLIQPNITTQPIGATLCYNSTHSLSVAISGGILLSYQWQVSPNGVDTWSDVGANSSNYTTPAVLSNNYYKVIISSTGTGCTTPIESNVVAVLLETIIPTISCSGNISQNVDAGVCNASVSVPNATTGDNCSVSTLTWVMTGATIASSAATGINQIGTYTFSLGLTNVTYTVKDAAGNQALCSFTVTITDNEDPVITCPANVVTTTSADATGNCTTTAALGVPTTSDNCSVASVVAQVSGATINPATYAFPIGVTTVNWIVTDGSGRTANCNQTVTVTDNEDPVITCPANVVTTTSADATGNCTTTAALGVPTTSDNCSVASVVAQVSGATINPATYAFPIGVTTVNWIVTDGSGRTANCNQTVTVTDNEDPVITCPANVVTTTSADATGNCTTTAALGVPTTSDNCSVASVVAQVSGATINPATYAFPIGVTTVNWIVTDGSGRTANCNQTVTVTDNEDPVITCPANVVTTTSADATGNCTTTAALGVPTTSDNCSVASVVAQVSGATINPATYAFPIGVTTVNWIVTDGSGRTANCNQTVTVTDNEDPVITCPANVVTTTSADATGNCTTTAALGVPTTSDNCSVASVVAQVSGATINPATYAFPIGVTTVNWIVTDGSGRTANCNQTVTVTDNEDPVITCPANVVTTTSADATGNCTTTAALGVPTTSDNCSVASVVAQVSGATINPATYAFPIGVTTVNWIVTDGSGRTANCNQTVTVTDNEDPVITCPANVVTTTSADATGNCTTTAALGVPTTSDNCSVASVVAQVSGATINPATYAFPIGVTTVNWIVTDGSGRTANCNQTVTVTDNEDPVITCPANVVTTTSADATGNCTTTAALGVPTTSDNCSVASVVAQVSGATINPATYAFPIGVTTVNWIVTDGSGRTANCNQTVTVTDNEDPVITCPANVVTTTSADATGNCTTTAALGVPTTSDNCSVASVVAQVSGATINPATYAFPIGVTTVNWIVTDGSGRTANCNQTVTVTDNEDPVITCPANVVTTTSADATGNCTTTAALGVPTTSDNCSVASVVAQVSGATINPATYAFPIGVTTVNWIVTDGSGRTANCNQTVTVTDNEDPVITCPANVVTTTSADATGNCTTTAALGVPTTSDNCSVASVVAQVSGATINPATYAFPIGVTTVNWIVTDGSGRTANCNQTVTVTDNEDPVITCPANVVTTTSADATGNCTTTAALGVPTTSDNCSVASVVAQVSGATINPATYAFPIGVTTVNWIVTDGSGRTANCNQTVTVTDNEDPVITCPANVVTTTSADATGNCTTTAALGVPTTSDNCSVASVVAQVSGATINPATYAFPIGVTTVNWIVTDGSGRTANCNQTVTVTDNEDPVITCPANITHNADAGLCTYTVAVGVPVTVDNCGVSTVVGTRSDSQLLTDPYPVGLTTIHWIVTDLHSNTSSCDQTVTITDNEIPSITCPVNITHTADAGFCSYTVPVGTPLTSDNCGVQTVVGTRSDSQILTNPYPVGVTTIHWVVTDIHGNTNNCDQTITVTDNEVPAITCPADVILNCEDDHTPAGAGTATATDNCTPGAGIVITYSDLSTFNADPANILHYNYAISRNWKATDLAGNFSECTQTITVHDITTPVITCPADITIDCEDDMTPAGTGTATATDICTPAANITIGYTDVSTYSSDPSNVLHYNYTITRTWKATDISGNFSECTQTVTVHDITKPVISCPSNVTISCESNNTPAGTGTATATDNCAPSTDISISYTDVSTYNPDPSTVLNYNYTITRRWRATDVAGNFEECIQLITVHDVTNPVISCPTNLTLNCDADNTPVSTGTATATDNCTPVANITITHTDLSTYSPDPLNILHYNYLIIRTWRARDVAGNLASCTQSISVHDITAPVITCPVNIVINCDNDNTPAGTGTATATDNCSPVANITIGHADVSTYSTDPASLLHYNYVITRTWRATDVMGNFSVCIQTITVHDITTPVITCPADITIDCEDDKSPAGTGTATATDICTPLANITIGYTDVSTYSSDPSNVLHYNYIITRTWKATDVAANFSECTQIITVHDITAPVITCPADITVNCNDNNTPVGTGTATATDNCGPVANITIGFTDVSTYDIDPSTVLHYNYTITRTWRATDVTGNFSECTQIVTVHDITNPVITCPSDVTTDCEDDNTPTATGTATATDICSPVANITIGFTDVSTYSIDPSNVLHYNYTISRTWRATDVSGNFNECTQTITVHDITKPVITCPADVTVDCEDDNTPAGTGSATATDICTPVSNITIGYTDVSTYNINPSNVLHYNYTITRTWKATDVAGNFSECPQIITVHDITTPVITCPADITIDCEDDKSPAGTGTATATDICTPLANITIGYTDVSTYSSDPSNVLHYNYIITRTWKATDVAANFSECTQIITVHDITAPVITCPADITVNCNDNNTPVGTGTATATDNCGPVANITIGFTDVSTYDIDPSTVLHYNYTITRTWRATDVTGNFSECTQIVTVHDITNPVITCPSDVTVDCEDDNTPTATGTATATDICSPVVNITIGFTDVSTYSIDPSNVLHYNYTISRTWRATDVSGNFNECTQTITVHDITKPVITCPADVTVDCEDDNTPAGTGSATATDICTPVANITIGYTDVSTYNINPSNVLHYNYTITRTWKATDVAGNFSECPQIITVHDITTPVITCPADITIDCEDDKSPAGTGTATATDICTPLANITIGYTDVSTYSSDPSNVLHYNYIITRTWKATDVAANFSECTQIITVHDITAPVITCPADITVNCNDNNTPVGTGTATATDNCGPVANITIGFTDVSTYDIDPSTVLHYNYTITRTWRATDVTGNFSECTQIVTVHDITNPVITCPSDVTVDCEDDNTPTATGTATATDICSPVVNITIGFTDVSTYSIDPSNVLHYNYTISRTWRATDVSGNFNECTQTITVHDITKPVITCPADVTVDCEDDNTPAGTGSATATDICTPVANITIGYTDVSTYNINPSNVLHYNYTITRTWKATDVAGNFSECPQIITVHDITTPVITCPADITIDCEDDKSPAGTGTATATDICTPLANITIGYTDVSTYSSDPSNVLHYNYIITRTWKATDVAANFSECTQIITVHDITAPVITCPADITVNCNDNNTPVGTGTATVTDNCGPVANITIGFTDVSTYDIDPSTVLHYNYTITRTWRATDVTGNFSECTQIVTVHDITNPAFTVPGTITICRASDCSYDISTAATGDVTDESDNCTPASLLNATYTDNLTGLVDCNNFGFIIRTWTLADITGNTTVKTQTIWIEPTPSVVIVNNSAVICDGASVSILFNSPSISINSGNLSYVVTVSSTDPGHLGGTASTGFTKLKADLPYTLTGTLTNSADAPIVVTYTVTPGLNGCSNGPVQTTTVTVEPTPQVTPSPLTQTICNNSATNVVLGSPSTFVSGNITFNYTAIGTGGITGYSATMSGLPKDHIIADILQNPTDSPQTVTYSIVPVSPSGCAAGPVKEVVITVDPTPQIIPSSLSQTICNDGTTSITLGSPSIFSSGVIKFDYTVVATGGVTGFTTPVTGLGKDFIISDVLHNPSDAPQLVTYTIVPVSPGGCPSGPSKIVVITVNPSPQVIPGTLAQSICNDGTTNVILASPSTFTSGVITFNYTVSATGGVTGFSTPLTGLSKDHIIADILHNPTDAPQTVTYSVVPISPTGCTAGPASVIVVTVDPTPVVVPSAYTQKICNEGSTSIVLTSPSTFASGVITFNYTVTATGGVTGFSTPVTGLPKDFVISDVLLNPTNDPQTVTYTIVPVSPVGCAAGPSKIVVITVEPTPQVVPSTLSQTICNDGVTNIVLSSPSTFTNGVITFNYTVIATGGVTGFTTPVAGLPNNSVIADALHNPSDAPQTVTYRIVPISPECSATDPIKIVVVTVDPTPQVIPSSMTKAICNDGTPDITLGSQSTFTSGVITFNYTVTATGGVTGFATPLTGLPKDYVISDILHNPTDAPQTVTYSIIPINPTGCANGPAKVVVVTVDPTPQVVPATLAQTICNDQPLNITLGSPSTFSSGVITFNYTVTATGGVTGFTTPLEGLPKDHIISDILHNPTDAPQTVTYTIEPVSPAGCPSGPPKVIVITVNPSPQVVPSLLTQTICNDDALSITLASPSTFTTGVITFNYTVSATGGVTGYTTPVTGLPKDHVITDILHNPTDAPQTVTYSIVPISPNGCSPGPSKTIIITVNPTPQVIPSSLTQIICNDARTNIILASPSTFSNGVITFNYTAIGTGGVTGFAPSLTGLPKDHVIADLLHNPTDAPQTVTYTVIPISPTGCSAGPPKVITVTVNPTPQVVPGTLAQTICNDGTTNIILASPSTFTSGFITFNYTVTATGGVTGFTTPVTGLPKDHIIADMLHNPSNAPQTVTYTVIPVSPTGCPTGPAKIIVVTVNPTPQVFPSTLTQTICNDGTTNVVLASPSTFTTGVITFNYTVSATGGVTGFLTPRTGLPKDHIIADVLHNPTNAPQTVTYAIVPVSPTGCAAGPTKIVVITVNPTPQVVPSTLAQTLCNDGTTAITLASPSTFSNGVITFNYSVVATGGVTGFTTPVTGLPKDHIIADILHNPTDGPQTVTYSIVPISPSLCASGPIKVVVVTVNPTPRIYPIPPSTTQCDSITTNIRLQSPSLFSNGLITFRYSVTTTGTVSGFSTPVAGLPNNHIIADKLINLTDHFQIVTYTIVPVSPSGCASGPSQVITVTVNPTPRIVATNNYPEICYVGTLLAPVNTQVVLTSPTVMTSGAIRFDYTISVTGGPGVIVGNTSPGTNLLPGHTINFTYQNNSAGLQSIYYSITPKVDNAICNPGKRVISEVKVHAQPLQNITVTKPLTCSDGAGLAALAAVISTGANPYQVVWNGPVGYYKEDSLTIANLSSGKYVLKVTDNLGCNRKDSISILPVAARAYISADVIPPGNYNISCVGSSDGIILVSVTGGITAPYNYTVLKNDTEVLYTGIFTNNLNLSDPTTFRYYTNLGAGSYTLKIRDVNGCENINRIVFRVPPPISTVLSKSTYAGGFNISCRGYNDGSAWVQSISGGRGGYSYRWYTIDGLIPGPVNTNRIDNLIAGTYYLEIKDVLNCVQVESVVITEPAGMQLFSYQLSKSLDNDYNISCNGNSDGSILMTVSGGSGNYVYSWTGPGGYTASTKDISNLRAGTYTCTVRDLNGCILTPSPTFTLTEPTILEISSSTTSVSVDGAYNINCYGANSGWINLIVSGGSTATYKYNWSTTNGSGIVNGQKNQSLLTAGTYHVVVTDSNRCVTTKDITLTQPPDLVVHLTSTNITCQSPGFDNGAIDLTVSGGIAPYSYLWSNGTITQDLSGLTTGNYEVTVTDFNGCIKKASITVQLPPALNYSKVISDYNGFNISCNGMADGFINVNPTTGLAPFIYTWTGPNGFTSTTKNIASLRAGQYQLLIVDKNECRASETFTLTEPGKLSITYSVPASNAGGFNLNCAGDSAGYINIVPVNQVNNVDYLWSDGIFGSSRTNLPAGSYSVIITDANNCRANSTVIITEPDPLNLVFDILPPFCPDKPDGTITTNVTGGVHAADYSYRWSDNSTNRNLVNIPGGYYQVTVTDLNGCSIRDSVTVTAVNETCLVIPNAISPNGDLINDVWNIGLKELYPLMEIRIFNRWGETVWRSEKGYPDPWDGKSNGTLLPIDSYHYVIDLHNGSKPLIGNITIVR